MIHNLKKKKNTKSQSTQEACWVKHENNRTKMNEKYNYQAKQVKK